MSTMEKGGINIRPMEHKYIDDVLVIYNKTREEKLGGTKLKRPTDMGILTYEDIAAIDPGSQLDLSFIAEVNGQVAGFIWGRLAYVGIPVKEVGLVYMLIVDPDFRRQSIARGLVDALAERCRAKGVDTIRTVVGDRDWQLSNFFNALGFQYSGLVIYTKTVES